MDILSVKKCAKRSPIEVAVDEEGKGEADLRSKSLLTVTARDAEDYQTMKIPVWKILLSTAFISMYVQIVHYDVIIISMIDNNNDKKVNVANFLRKSLKQMRSLLWSFVTRSPSATGARNTKAISTGP